MKEQKELNIGISLICVDTCETRCFEGDGGRGSTLGRVRVIPTELSSCRSPEYFPLDEGHSRKGTRGLYLPTVYFLKPCYDVVI